MAASPSNHWKLGLFVVSGVVLGLSTLVVLGARNLRKETVTYDSFFDESVQGLETGSPVKFRGVTIGTVSSIGVAPDRRHVMIASELAQDDMRVMGLSSGVGKEFRIRVPADLRIQLASAGITGVKFLQLDFFPLATNPPPVLPFPTPDNYIPAAVSTMKNLEDAVVRAVDRFPEMTDAALQVLSKLDKLLDEVGENHLPDRTGTVLTKVDETLAEVRSSLKGLGTRELSARAQRTLDKLDETVSRTNRLLARVDGEKGALASMERASNAVGDVATNARGMGEDLASTLRDVQLAAESIQKLTDALELDSDMLVKGRARVAR